MKKSLIALAVLAASGAAMAQSSVTLYGIADLWVGSAKSTGGSRVTLMESGGVNGSRWGLKGSEDLGGGLKANFDLQQGFAMDTGAAGSTSASAFSRQSWVGFSGGFGALRLGRTTTPYDDVSGAADAVFDSALAPANAVFKSTKYSGRQNNMFYYQAPNFGGVSGALSYSLDEKSAANDEVTSVNVTYAGGPLGLHLAFQNQQNSARTYDIDFLRLGGSFNFGMATLKANYGEAKNYQLKGGKTKDFQIGVDVPMGSALTLSASYAKSDDNATAGDASRDGFGVAAAYTLSKRTFLYGGFRHNEDDMGPAAATVKTDVFAVGVQHRF
jgi:predicted porin